MRSSRRMYVSQRGSLEKHQSLRGEQVPRMWASCCRDFFALSVDVSQTFCKYFLNECKVQGEINHPRSLGRILRDRGGRQALSCIASIRQPSRRAFHAGDWRSVSSAGEQWRWERLKASSEQAFWRVWKGRVEDYVGRKTVGMGPRWLAGWKHWKWALFGLWVLLLATCNQIYQPDGGSGSPPVVPTPASLASLGNPLEVQPLRL